MLSHVSVFLYPRQEGLSGRAVGSHGALPVVHITAPEVLLLHTPWRGAKSGGTAGLHLHTSSPQDLCQASLMIEASHFSSNTQINTSKAAFNIKMVNVHHKGHFS